MKSPEILAPAGSYESFLAAVHNGCDAVYLGGKAYGARAYAKNFDIETLERTVNYAQKYAVKVYYTINTLFKEKEIKGLVDHLEEVLSAGVDALIVQDIGVLKVIREAFPKAELHASTQMNCHSIEGINFLSKLGVSRVVLGRELNIEEIKTIKSQSTMALETFVHGALCYCYSGQCLMSSYLGGRSGNRGRCAQPCRLTYKARVDGQVKDPTHVLSPKDIETLSILPDIIEAGVDSLKIEGRMKSPEYVGLMTALYKKYRDLYLESATYSVTQEDMNDMLQIFNRGDFSTGYYKQHSGPEMITFDQPKNQGRVIGQVINIQGNSVAFKVNECIEPGDCLEFLCKDRSYHSLIIQKPIKLQGKVSVEVALEPNSPVRRIKSVALSQRLLKTNVAPPSGLVTFDATLEVGKKASLTIRDHRRSMTVLGEDVQEATKQGMSEEKVLKQLKKIGSYPITIDKIQLTLDPNVFMPVSHLNALRRKALDQWLSIEAKASLERQALKVEKIKLMPTSDRNITVLLRNWHQFETVIDYDVKRIYLEWVNFTKEQIEKAIQLVAAKGSNTKLWLAVPKIVRQEKFAQIKKLMSHVPKGIEGFLLRSIDSYQWVDTYDRQIQWDYSLNIMNHWSADVLLASKGAIGYVPSMELKFGEHKGLPMSASEVVVYGHINVMTSAQCVRKSLDGCTYDQGYIMDLEDRKGIEVPVETNCLLCYNNIYNGLPLYLIDRIGEFQRLGCAWYRLELLNEPKVLIKKVLNASIKGQETDPQNIVEAYTRGHYNKGVE